MPAWSALIVQVPAARIASVPPAVVVQNAAVDDVKVTARAELALALSVGAKPLWIPGFAKVIVCGALGVTPLENAEGFPAPAALVALTANTYAVPLVRVLTVIEEHGAVQVPVLPSGDEVAV